MKVILTELDREQLDRKDRLDLIDRQFIESVEWLNKHFSATNHDLSQAVLMQDYINHIINYAVINNFIEVENG